MTIKKKYALKFTFGCSEGSFSLKGKRKYHKLIQWVWFCRRVLSYYLELGQLQIFCEGPDLGQFLVVWPILSYPDFSEITKKERQWRSLKLRITVGMDVHINVNVFGLFVLILPPKITLIILEWLSNCKMETSHLSQEHHIFIPDALCSFFASCLHGLFTSWIHRFVLEIFCFENASPQRNILIQQMEDHYSHIYRKILGNRNCQTPIFVPFLVHNILSND